MNPVGVPNPGDKVLFAPKRRNLCRGVVHRVRAGGVVVLRGASFYFRPYAELRGEWR